MISVVIPLYNKENYIKRAIDSVLNQTYQDFAIVVVDDGSLDNGCRIVEGIKDNRIRLFQQPNQGPSVARNKGITEAEGNLIAFLDADDEWRPHFLETVLALRDKCPQAGAYATGYESRQPNGRVRFPAYKEIPPSPWEGIIPNFFRSDLRGPCPVWTSAIAIRREVFDKVGCFVLCAGLGQDKELWGRIALKYPIAFSWRVSAICHREAENRRCNTVFTSVFVSDSFERAMRSHEIPSHILPDVKEFLAKERLCAASRYVLGGQPEIARRILRNCKTQLFFRRKLWWWFWSFMPRQFIAFVWFTKSIVNQLLRGRKKNFVEEQKGLTQGGS